MNNSIPLKPFLSPALQAFLLRSPGCSGSGRGHAPSTVRGPISNQFLKIFNDHNQSLVQTMTDPLNLISSRMTETLHELQRYSKTYKCVIEDNTDCIIKAPTLALKMRLEMIEKKLRPILATLETEEETNRMKETVYTVLGDVLAMGAFRISQWDGIRHGAHDACNRKAISVCTIDDISKFLDDVIKTLEESSKTGLSVNPLRIGALDLQSFSELDLPRRMFALKQMGLKSEEIGLDERCTGTPELALKDPHILFQLMLNTDLAREQHYMSTCSAVALNRALMNKMPTTFEGISVAQRLVKTIKEKIEADKSTLKTQRVFEPNFVKGMAEVIGAGSTPQNKYDHISEVLRDSETKLRLYRSRLFAAIVRYNRDSVSANFLAQVRNVGKDLDMVFQRLAIVINPSDIAQVLPKQIPNQWGLSIIPAMCQAVMSGHSLSAFVEKGSVDTTCLIRSYECFLTQQLFPHIREENIDEKDVSKRLVLIQKLRYPYMRSGGRPVGVDGRLCGHAIFVKPVRYGGRSLWVVNDPKFESYQPSLTDIELAGNIPLFRALFGVFDA